MSTARNYMDVMWIYIRVDYIISMGFLLVIRMLNIYIYIQDRHTCMYLIIGTHLKH